MTSTTIIPLERGALHILAKGPKGVARLNDLCAFANRQNPKRSFLFVSKVLGKHIPVRPSTVLATQQQLAQQLLPSLARSDSALLIGFAETATGLGAGVFEHCARALPDTRLLYQQTTRYHHARPLVLNFQEEHSHATGHLLYEPDTHAEVMRNTRTLVLIDDEFTTGKTCANFIQAFREINPNIDTVVMASLLNWMSAERRAEVARQVGLPIQFVSLLDGVYSFVPHSEAALPSLPNAVGNGENKDALLPAAYGWKGEIAPLALNFDAVVARLGLKQEETIHVLGDGEFMHPPLLLAAHLEQLGYDVYFHATTRSPVRVGQAIQRKVEFPDHYGDGITNYVYNLPDPVVGLRVVLCHDAAADLTLPRERAMDTVAFEELLCA